MAPVVEKCRGSPGVATGTKHAKFNLRDETSLGPIAGFEILVPGRQDAFAKRI